MVKEPYSAAALPCNNTNTHPESVEDYRFLSDQYSAFFFPPPSRVSSFRSSHRFAVSRRQPGFACVGNRAARPRPCDRKCEKSEIRTICHSMQDAHSSHCNCVHTERTIKQLWRSARVLCAVIWIHRRTRDVERHLALRLQFQPKGSKHLIPAAQSFYTIRGNSSCYHSVPSEC